MKKEMTLEQIEKANEFAKLFATVSDTVGYPDLELTKTIFNKVNGIEKDEQKGYSVNVEFGENDVESEITKYINKQLDSIGSIFGGKLDSTEVNVINCCNCSCSK